MNPYGSRVLLATLASPERPSVAVVTLNLAMAGIAVLGTLVTSRARSANELTAMSAGR